MENNKNILDETPQSSKDKTQTQQDDFKITWNQDEDDFLNEVEDMCRNNSEFEKLFFVKERSVTNDENIFSEDEDTMHSIIEGSCVNKFLKTDLLDDKDNNINLSNNTSDINSFTFPKQYSPPQNNFETQETNLKISDNTFLLTPDNSLNNNQENSMFNLDEIFTTPKKKSIITSQDYLDYSPYATPEKGSADPSFSFAPSRTLSQLYEEELKDDLQSNYTKTKNLTEAEKYDLKRDFAPQPGTSKDSEFYQQQPVDYGDDVIENSQNSSIYCFQPNHLSSILNFLKNETSNSNVWMLKYYPPSGKEIKNNLSDYNIPENRYQEPFYSEFSDVTGKIEIGHNVLKIPSKTTADLEEFNCSIEFDGIEAWRQEKFKTMYPFAKLPPKNNFRVTFSGNDEFIMQLAVPPPTYRDVVLWLNLKLEEKQNEIINKPKKIRIVVPCSPGQGDDSCDESFTLSPNVVSPTPSQSTPLSSQDSPLLNKRGKISRKGTLQRKALFSQTLKSSQEHNNFKDLQLSEPHSHNDSCQITGVTLDNTHGFKLSYENLQQAKAVSEHELLTILVVELHIRTRGELKPDPQYDAVRAIFYSISNDVPEEFHLPREETGVIVVNSLPITPTKQAPSPILDGTGITCKIIYVTSELELIDELIKLIRKWDPDIFTGFEIEMLSWGYLIERCYVLGINLPQNISRINPDILKKKTSQNLEPSKDEIKLTGRIVLDAWRLFRNEIALTSYTFENLMYHILHRRIPVYSFKNLSFWWDHRSNYYRSITANYYIIRVQGVLKLMDQLDLIGRTCELARLFGIQFYEVLSRGSQFRVESMMLRLARPLNYIAVSPSKQQRAQMRAPEYIPMILEPESRFYVDPMIVLDFQSLYPSIMIAYNYCFSTCIGRVDKLGTNQPFEFGATQFKISRSTLRKLENKLNFSPCGVGFVTPEVRKGILPKMLQEILETRLMVKASMKQNKDNKILQRVLHNRQLGLKLIANVTYGYTAANFSGRMPCVEVADSVVSKGRETLERAIKLIEQTKRWNAKVVYGDTDSLFVLVAGRSREDAFKIGEEIAEAVTNDNPPPIKLKLEKVYHPCILQTKKRYVGYMYESPDQQEPEYNAKGIETVRRDGCPAVAKMLEKCLRILFDTRDVSLVKRYVCRQFEKLLSGRASVQDLVFAREYRGASGYRPGACVPALELARRWTAMDKRREPRTKERVPYIIVHGPPGVPLIRLVRCPRDLLTTDQNQQMSYRPNAIYYISKVIGPALNRCISLIGADVLAWFNNMPRKQLQILPTDIHFENIKKSTISQYFSTMNCLVCNNQTRDGLCENCCNKPQLTIVTLQEKISQWERSFYEVNQICVSCCGRSEYTECFSLDCPVLYRLNQTKRDIKQVPFLRNLILKF